MRPSWPPAVPMATNRVPGKRSMGGLGVAPGAVVCACATGEKSCRPSVPEVAAVKCPSPPCKFLLHIG